MLHRKNHLACYQNKDWRGSLQIPLKQSSYSGKFVFTEPVAAHPIKVDKCGGEIAKLATSSHKKAI